jgi:hypothetical protein
MSSNFESINSDDIIVFTGPKVFVVRSPAFGKEVLDGLERALKNYVEPNDKLGDFLTDGLKCRILRPGNQWIEGKLKIRMEFEPNPPKNSPLDEFRTDT